MLNGHLEVIRSILEDGAAADLVDSGGNSPLHCAASNGHADIVRFFVGRGALNTLRTNSRLTPLQLANEQNKKEVIAVLEMKRLKFSNLFRKEKKN